MRKSSTPVGKLDRVLVTGASGQLGHGFHTKLFRTEKDLTRTKEALNITELEKLRVWMQKLHPEIVINCAAYTRKQESESSWHTRQQCWRVNAEAVGNLAQICAEQKLFLVHISDALVLGGCDDVRKEYNERTIPAPTGFYAQTKLAGEQALLQVAADNPNFQYLLIRTAGLFEKPWRYHKNFAMQVKQNFERGKTVTAAINDCWTSLTYVPHLVDAVWWMLENRLGIPRGVYHITNTGYCSWYDAAKFVGRKFHSPQQVVPVGRDIYYANYATSELNLTPRSSILSSANYVDLGAPPMPTWEQALQTWCKLALKKKLPESGLAGVNNR